MLYDAQYHSSDMHINNIHAMLMTSEDYANYLITQFPYELNDLTAMKVLYPSLIMEVWHVRMPIKTTSTRCLVLNALVALWPSQMVSEVAVVEFRSIQKPYQIEPDITQCKKILLALIKDKWGVTFKGKELITCS
jgi:hypothetical protein